MKKVLALLLCVCMLISALAGCGQDQPTESTPGSGNQPTQGSVPTQGQPNEPTQPTQEKPGTENNTHTASEGLDFKLNSDGNSYYVAGIGSCKDADVVIPDTYEGLPVTMLGHRAFNRCNNLTSVTLPDSITTIGQSPFESCNGLKKLVIGAGLATAYETTFQGCANLESIEVSADNPNFYVVNNCLIEKATGKLMLGVQNAVIPTDGSVKVIGYRAFKDAKWLTQVVIPSGVTQIESFAFDGCSGLAAVEFCDTLKKIGYGAFIGTAITQLHIPGNVEEIGDEAFAYCANLTSVVIDEGVKHLAGAFGRCTSLTTVSLPKSLEFLGYSYLFTGCGAIEIQYSGTAADWKLICEPSQVSGFCDVNGNITVHCTDSTLVFESIKTS